MNFDYRNHYQNLVDDLNEVLKRSMEALPEEDRCSLLLYNDKVYNMDIGIEADIQVENVKSVKYNTRRRSYLLIEE